MLYRGMERWLRPSWGKQTRLPKLETRENGLAPTYYNSPRGMHTFWCILNNQSGIWLHSLGTTLCPTFIVDLIFTFGKMPCDRLFPKAECHWSRRVALTLHNFCGFGRWRWCRAPSCSPNITGCSIEMIFWYSVIVCNYILQQFVGHFPRQSNLIEVDVVIGSLIMDHHRCYERHLQQSG